MESDPTTDYLASRDDTCPPKRERSGEDDGEEEVNDSTYAGAYVMLR